MVECFVRWTLNKRYNSTTLSPFSISCHIRDISSGSPKINILYSCHFKLNPLQIAELTLVLSFRHHTTLYCNWKFYNRIKLCFATIEKLLFSYYTLCKPRHWRILKFAIYHRKMMFRFSLLFKSFSQSKLPCKT